MTFEPDIAFITAVALVFIRLSTLLLLSPLLATARVPVNVRTLLLLALAVTLVTGLQVQPATVPQTSGDFLLAAIHEFVVGALMAFGLFTAFAALQFGGRILDFQMGFGVANLIDPATNTQSPLLGTILNLMAVATFFLLDGHHMVIRGVAYSFEQVPPGQGLSMLGIDAVVLQFGRMFVYGLMLVAPAVVAVLMLDVGLAVSARTMPQVNIFIVGLPLKIFVGVTVLTISLKYVSPLLDRLFESIFRYWERILI